LEILLAERATVDTSEQRSDSIEHSVGMVGQFTAAVGTVAQFHVLKRFTLTADGKNCVSKFAWLS
jgi:hypothetical protein